MSKAPVYVDGMLVDWGTTLFNMSPVVPKKGVKSHSTGLVVPLKKHGGGGGVERREMKSNAKAIRGKLGSIVRKAPEVMVKISGGGKGMKQIKDHLDYISRNGKLDIEDQDGNVIKGREELADLRDEWMHGGFQIPEEGSKREAFNIVLSMPEGTSEVAVKRAARDFAAREFPNHQYVMVQHTYDTDPDPEPSKHPHVHLCVKSRSLDGIRLNPRKADLQAWREGFAEALREHGVEAAATKRVQRVLRTRTNKEKRFLSVQHQMEGEGRAPSKVNRDDITAERIAKAKATERSVLRGYHQLTKALSESPDVEDRKLAAGLVHRLSEQQSEVKHEKDRSTDR